MKISPDNPHLKALKIDIIKEFLWPYPRKDLLWLSAEEFDEMYERFSFLWEAEQLAIIDKIIIAYFAQQTYNALIWKAKQSSSSYSGKTATK
jgi:hypothetical protein